MAKEEPQWWYQHLQEWSGKTISKTDLDMFIETDASILGWGTHCAYIQTGGLWSDKKCMMHIKCLELPGGVKALEKTSKDCHIRLTMDNTTAISYTNKMGGTHSHTLAKMAAFGNGA